MADQRVHPRADSPPRDSVSSSGTDFAMKLYQPSSDHPVQPPPGTCVIQIPRDQIYRVPPPENEYKFRNYTRQSKRRSRRCRCCFWMLALIAVVAVLAGVAVGVFYLVIRPQTPRYSIDALTFSGFNLTSSTIASPGIDVAVRADNPNKRIAIDYRAGGYAVVYHGGLKLCDGELPALLQPRRNVTVIEAALRGPGLVLGTEARDAIVREQRAGSVPLRLNLRSPVRLGVGDVMTWTITVKVRCDVTVDRLAAGAKIVSKSCDFGVKLW
uniref:Late embryogenesis abundant protein LEA-2 subgroup domain-containing protein n=1 Tax=Kalanchoe fedtschenkoi TaxID=63787 RepID=A0A7N0VKZ6_KALFE